MDIRCPSEDVASLAPIVDFVREHLVSSLDLTSIRTLLDAILRHDRRQVLDVWSDGSRALVGCVMTGLGSADDPAELLILARAPGSAVRGDALLDYAESLVSEPNIEVILVPATEELRPALESRGYVHCYDNVAMNLDDVTSAVACRAPIPEGLRWQDVDERTVPAAHACYGAAFQGVDGAPTLHLDDFSRFMFTAQIRPRVLLDGERGVAFARVVWKDEATDVGEVRIICRDPKDQRQGLGRLALEEALAMLQDAGARSAWLEVVSNNPRAIRLYERNGFQTTSSCAAFRKQLRS